jgi:tetratricopeptide (TPR) repeat protein
MSRWLAPLCSLLISATAIATPKKRSEWDDAFSRAASLQWKEAAIEFKRIADRHGGTRKETQALLLRDLALIMHENPVEDAVYYRLVAAAGGSATIERRVARELQSNRNDWRLLVMRAIILSGSDHCSDALQLLENINASNEGITAAVSSLAEACRERLRGQRAASAAEKALEEERYGDAARLFEIAIDRLPDRPELNLSGAVAWFAAGDMNAALGALRAAKEKGRLRDVRAAMVEEHELRRIDSYLSPRYQGAPPAAKLAGPIDDALEEVANAAARARWQLRTAERESRQREEEEERRAAEAAEKYRFESCMASCEMEYKSCVNEAIATCQIEDTSYGSYDERLKTLDRNHRCRETQDMLRWNCRANIKDNCKPRCKNQD